ICASRSTSISSSRRSRRTASFDGRSVGARRAVSPLVQLALAFLVILGRRRIELPALIVAAFDLLGRVQRLGIAVADADGLPVLGASSRFGTVVSYVHVSFTRCRLTNVLRRLKRGTEWRQRDRYYATQRRVRCSAPRRISWHGCCSSADHARTHRFVGTRLLL